MKIANLIACAATVVLCAAPARAATPSAKIAATFGNTVMSIYPDGRSQKIWLKPDGSWSGQSRRGHPLAGSWTAKGDQVCLKQSRPALPFGHFCQVFPNDPATGVDSKDLTGAKIHLKLVRGHVTKAES